MLGGRGEVGSLGGETEDCIPGDSARVCAFGPQGVGIGDHLSLVGLSAVCRTSDVVTARQGNRGNKFIKLSLKGFQLPRIYD